MIKDVIIDITGKQENDGDENVIEFNTEGRFGFRNGDYFLMYEEGEISGLGDIRTVLRIKSDNSVILSRSGTITNRFEIEKGKRNISFYHTPYGDMSIGIYGESVKHSLSESGGRISLRYTIDSDQRPISRNTIHISVREEQ